MRLGIFALQDIAPGEELTYDYQFQHAGLASDAGAYRHAVVLKCRLLWNYPIGASRTTVNYCRNKP